MGTNVTKIPTHYIICFLSVLYYELCEPSKYIKNHAAFHAHFTLQQMVNFCIMTSNAYVLNARERQDFLDSIKSIRARSLPKPIA